MEKRKHSAPLLEWKGSAPASLAARKMEPESIMRMMDGARIAERRRHTVLVVSFDHDAIRFKEDALGHFGYRVKSAATVADALELFRGGGISLVLSECQMPEINAISMLRGYLDHSATAKVILITGRRFDSGSASILMNSGAAEVIERPYRLANLAFAMDAHLSITGAFAQ